MSALDAQPVQAVLDRLHGAARRDWLTMLPVLPRALARLARGQSLMQALRPQDLKDVYIPVSREQGRLLYATARSIGARRIVEFGCSFGISTLYLAAAAKETGGRVITTEIQPEKCRATEASLKEAELADWVDVWEGDALASLKSAPDAIDLVFLDGWKDLYQPVLELLLPKLREAALVIADNVNFAESKVYARKMKSRPDFVSTTLNGDTELSVFVPGVRSSER